MDLGEIRRIELIVKHFLVEDARQRARFGRDHPDPVGGAPAAEFVFAFEVIEELLRLNN